MKSITSAAILFLLCSPPLEAKILHSFSVKAGLVIAHQDFDYAHIPDPQWDSRLGFCAGGFVEWLEGSRFHVLTEALYVQKGMNTEVEGRDENNMPTGTVTLDQRVDYLSVTVALKLGLKSPVISPYILAGPRADILLGYDVGEGYDALYDEFKSVEFGADAGVGTELCLGHLPVFLVEFRYSPDFTSAYKTDLLEVSNGSIGILAGVKF